MKNIKTYKYEWTTAEEVIANMDTVVKFPTFGVGSVAKKTGVTNPETYRKAHELWLKLKDAFNAEAATYDPEAYDSNLGSQARGFENKMVGRIKHLRRRRVR